MGLRDFAGSRRKHFLSVFHKSINQRQKVKLNRSLQNRKSWFLRKNGQTQTREKWRSLGNGEKYSIIRLFVEWTLWSVLSIGGLPSWVASFSKQDPQLFWYIFAKNELFRFSSIRWPRRSKNYKRVKKFVAWGQCGARSDRDKPRWERLTQSRPSRKG